MTPSSTDRAAQIAATRSLARTRWRVAAILTLLMVAVYFGFILLVAYQRALLGGLVSDGLSLGIVLGALVILSAWVLTLIYVQWANRVYDPALAALRAMPGADPAARGPQEGAR
jgi:uncharacterized membrane protein (DUF485 family)